MVATAQCIPMLGASYKVYSLNRAYTVHLEVIPMTSPVLLKLGNPSKDLNVRGAVQPLQTTAWACGNKQRNPFISIKFPIWSCYLTVLSMRKVFKFYLFICLDVTVSCYYSLCFEIWLISCCSLAGLPSAIPRFSQQFPPHFPQSSRVRVVCLSSVSPAGPTPGLSSLKWCQIS